jgi:hypothetical protein
MAGFVGPGGFCLRGVCIICTNTPVAAGFFRRRRAYGQFTMIVVLWETRGWTVKGPAQGRAGRVGWLGR